MLLKTSKIAAFLLLFLNVWLREIHRGFEAGYRVFLKSSISVGSASAYGFLEQKYLFLILLTSVFLFGKLIKKEFMSRIICFTSLGCMFFIYWQIFLQKRVYYAENYNDFNRLLIDSIPFDLISFTLTVFLVVIQFTTILPRQRAGNEHGINIK